MENQVITKGAFTSPCNFPLPPHPNNPSPILPQGFKPIFNPQGKRIKFFPQMPDFHLFLLFWLVSNIPIM